MRTALDPHRLRGVYDAAAGHYDLWHGFVTAHSDQRGRVMVVRAAVRPGDRVLDAGGGTGSTTLLAARAAGPGGSVTTLDLSAGMLARARTRASAVEAPVSLTLGDMLRLPFPDGAFDVVLSTYSTCPLTDPGLAGVEMLRVVRPGGLLGVAHSSEPRNRTVRWMADRFEDVAWRFPALSLGCRSVSVLPRLLDQGAEVTMHEHIGFPLWPFEVFVVRKPA
jgi:demethylmenaquinone methyltransferase/2-methoxy-6-polyprenyl-1,4-benzoquinol methylase